MLELYSVTFLSIFFFNISRCICKLNSLYIKFLYNFFLPDVASASMAPVIFVSLVLSLHVHAC